MVKPTHTYLAEDDVPSQDMDRVNRFLKRIELDPDFELVGKPEWYISEYEWPTNQNPDAINRVLKCKVVTRFLKPSFKSNFSMEQKIGNFYTFRYHGGQGRFFPDTDGSPRPIQLSRKNPLIASGIGQRA